MQNFTIHGVSNSPLFLEMAKRWPFYGQNRVLTWSFKLDLPESKSMFERWSIPNFTIMGVSHCPLFLGMAKILPFYGKNMVLTWSFKLVFPES